MNWNIASGRRPDISFLWSDQVIALIIFVFAALWGAKFVASDVVSPHFYQGTFGPAVMEACGKGFVQPKNIIDIPGLEDFLKLRKATFSCHQIPDEFERIPLNLLQTSGRYLMSTVALIWRTTEISWDALLPLYALFFGLSSTAIYGVFRLGMGKAIATLLAIVVLLSPMQLQNLPHLRDYSKAPFIIAIVLLFGWLVKQPTDPKKTVILSALAGAILGIGIGFRMDLLIFVPAFLITLTIFTPSCLAKDLGTKGWAIAVFTFTFFALGGPTLGALGNGGNTFHVILLGLFSPFDKALNIQPSAVYEWGYLYHDVYVHQILNSYAHRILDINVPINLATQAYDQAGLGYYLEILRLFPADIATRFLASALKIVQNTGFDAMPLWPGQLSLFALLASTFFIAAINLRIAIFALFAVLFLSGYPTLQFHERHFFQLQALPLFFLGFLVQQIFCQGWLAFGKSSTPTDWAQHLLSQLFPPGAIKRMATFTALLLVLTSLLLALRFYQQASLRILLENYEQLPIETIKIERSNNPDGSIFLRPIPRLSPSHLTNDDRPLLHTGYWGLVLDGGACNQQQISVRFQYRYSDPWLNFSRLMMFDAKKPLRYMFSSYSNFSPISEAAHGFTGFDGIAINKADYPCIKNFGPIRGFEKFPLLMNLTFREGWREDALYQTIGRKKNQPLPKRIGITLFAFPETIEITQQQASGLLSSMAAPAIENISIIDKTLTVADESLRFKGNATNLYSYILQLPVEKTDGKRYLVAEGELFDGGLTLGILKSNKWGGQINITTAGRFRAIMKPEKGEYIATLAHNVSEQKFNNFKLTKLGWTSGVE